MHNLYPERTEKTEKCMVFFYEQFAEDIWINNPSLRVKTKISVLEWNLWSCEAEMVVSRQSWGGCELDALVTHLRDHCPTFGQLCTLLKYSNTVGAPHLANWKCFKKTKCQRTSQGKCQPFFPLTAWENTWKFISSLTWKHTAKKTNLKGTKTFYHENLGQKKGNSKDMKNPTNNPEKN